MARINCCAGGAGAKMTTIQNGHRPGQVRNFNSDTTNNVDKGRPDNRVEFPAT